MPSRLTFFTQISVEQCRRAFPPSKKWGTIPPPPH